MLPYNRSCSRFCRSSEKNSREQASASSCDSCSVDTRIHNRYFLWAFALRLWNNIEWYRVAIRNKVIVAKGCAFYAHPFNLR